MSKQSKYKIESFLEGNRIQNTSEINRFFNKHYHRHDLDLAISNQAEFIFLARHKKELIGLSASLIDNDRTEATVILFVQPKWRERGIGSSLFERTISTVQSIGFDPNFIAFNPHDDQSLARFLSRYGMRYQYSDLYMSLDRKMQLPSLKQPDNVEIVSYDDQHYEAMVDLRNLGINEDQTLKHLEIRSVFQREDLSYRRWMRTQAQNSFVLLIDGELRAFTIAASDGEIRSVVVDPNFRGQGLATLLVTEAIKYQRKQKQEEIYLWVAQKNEPARHLYTKLGFSIRDRYDASYGRVKLHPEEK